MPQSPALGSEGVVRITVFSDGQLVGDGVQLISVSVSRVINTIPVAQIVVRDGDMARMRFEVSDTAVFKPGAAIRIAAGYGDTEETVFEGIVVKHGIKITGNNDSRLLVECRDAAMRMTVGRKNAHHGDRSDGTVIERLIAACGLTADVQGTGLQHGEVVQHYCSDWDFMLTRAEANGLLVVAHDGTVSVKPPQTSGTPVLKVAYGTDLIEFHADIDARTQWAAVQGFSWDVKTQAEVQGVEAAPPSLNRQGDLGGAELARVVGLGSYRLQSAAPLSASELTAWARAQQLKAGLARVRGRMKFQGSAKAVVGALMTVEGVGARFSGDVFVSAVHHEIRDGVWITEVDFGMAPEWFAERADVSAPAASGLLPGVEGLQIGVVAKLDGDPDGENRVQVSVPVLGAETAAVWARLAVPQGSSGFGAFVVPEIGDEVVLGYFNNDPSRPVVVGSLYSSKRPPPYPMTAANNVKAIVTRCQSKIEFDDEDKVVTVTTPGHNRIVLSDKGRSIVLVDQNDNKVELTAGGITLDSPGDIVLSAKGRITLDAVGAIDIRSKADLTQAGLNVNCEAQVGFVAKGTATAELSAAGQTVVKGAMVMIN